jgi:Asp-tRNA(Asn)/Glu-tRNA(Gln) amidotransferase A subunit family amidase
VAAVKDAAKLCESLGHKLEEAAPKIDYVRFGEAFGLVVQANTAAMLDLFGLLLGSKVTEEMVEPWTWSVAQNGWKATASSYVGTDRIINATTRAVASFLTEYDVILSPTLGLPPPKLGFMDPVKLSFEELSKRLSEFMPFTALYNATGMPAMSVPLYWNAEGFPVGVQFAGRYADEATLYRLAAQLEKERPWCGRVPAKAA